MVTLEGSKAFRDLSPGEMESLRRVAKEQRFPKGTEIFREGDAGDGIYLLKDGKVEIRLAAGTTETRGFATIAPGELFGEMAVLELKPRSATAIAVEDCIVEFLPRDELLAAIERSPLLAMSLLREVSQRLRDFNQRYIQDVLQSERLALIGRFARSIVHDIKNPLNIISLSAELSCMDKAPAESRFKSAATIRRQVERISDMIGEILEFTQGSRTDVILAEYDYAEFIRQIAEELKPEVELRKTNLSVGDLPSMFVRLDPKRLRRVFHNLVHNATDAMPGGGQIWIRVAANDSEIVTEIEDNGPGIAPEIAGKLFEAFATFGKAHGTGLGLSICKKIIEDHGGRIWTRSEPGRGAIFCFALTAARKSIVQP